MEVLGGLEGLLLSECIYTPGGQRPRRIADNLCNLLLDGGEEFGGDCNDFGDFGDLG